MGLGKRSDLGILMHVFNNIVKTRIIPFLLLLWKAYTLLTLDSDEVLKLVKLSIKLIFTYSFLFSGVAETF